MPTEKAKCVFRRKAAGHSGMAAFRRNTQAKYRFVPWEIEDVDGVVRQLPGGYADVTRGGGLKYDQVTFLGSEGTVRAALRLKKGDVRKLEQAGFASKVPQTGSE